LFTAVRPSGVSWRCSTHVSWSTCC